MTVPHPARPLSERSPEEIAEFVDDHVIMALNAADLLYGGERGDAEDYVRDRLVALSDTYQTMDALTVEEKIRRMQRLRAAIGLPR